MLYFLSLAELFTVIALLVFNSVLCNGGYERLPLKVFSKLICYSLVLYVISSMITALPAAGIVWSYQSVAIIAAHTVFHFITDVLLLFALVKFADVDFRYCGKHLIARGALYFAFVFEALALCAFVICCVQVF
jgi:hypothetical protein